MRIFEMYKKNVHTNFNFFTINRVHVKNLLFKNQINLLDNHLIDHHLRFRHLTRVA